VTKNRKVCPNCSTRLQIKAIVDSDQRIDAKWLYCEKCGWVHLLADDLETARSTIDDLKKRIGELEAEGAAYRKAYGCLGCGEDHPAESMCPPHEVRTAGQNWFFTRTKAAVARAEAAEQALTAERLRREEAEANHNNQASRIIELEAMLHARPTSGQLETLRARLNSAEAALRKYTGTDLPNSGAAASDHFSKYDSPHPSSLNEPGNGRNE
jgi:DNA repair exonuclease SbcCD ATPase subunit